MLTIEEIFPARLKAYMDLSGMNVAQLAEAAECSEDSIRKYMCGMTLPQFKTAFAIARALGCTPNDLCGISLSKPKKAATAR